MRTLILVLLLGLAAPAAFAAPNAQIVASVQQRLNVLGFRDVDASTLTTSQIGALHLELDSRALSFSGFNRINARSKVKVILDRN
jgi:hypothetical protein